MSEVTFAKAFLTTLDKKPIKLPADHVSDPRKYPNQSPFTLARQSHPYPKQAAKDLAQSQSNAITITITIKPMRAGETITLSKITLDESIHDIKTKYSAKISLPVDKIKLLLNKKPAADLKTLKDLGIDASSAAPTPATQIDTASADKMEVDSEAPHPGSEKAQVQAEEEATAPSGPGALHTVDFWKDLEAFLTQRLRDEKEAQRLAGLFKSAWASQ
ncbi:hypothetical protein AMS68_004163 [Peltaster fructicola]|uniref:Ubiquitin-like domain-containing protein n=1 Tax=Peltaster fructicola TaxID=286661 RepID=A0A6H0XVD1_9PEZI|nr:hypothetical protein AMS68_004163 [Peltaster fructicola]